MEKKLHVQDHTSPFQSVSLAIKTATFFFTFLLETELICMCYGQRAISTNPLCRFFSFSSFNSILRVQKSFRSNFLINQNVPELSGAYTIRSFA